MADFKRFMLRIPPALHEELEELAKREGRSLHNFLMHLIRKALDDAKNVR
jgi:predicted HicB family RNase H-like nuclease